jgi:hypothetical protein
MKYVYINLSVGHLDSCKRNYFNRAEGGGVTIFIILIWLKMSINVKRVSISVGIVQGDGLDDRGSRVQFPAGARNYSLQHLFQNGCGVYTASYPTGTRGCFTGDNATEAWSGPLTSI